LELGRNDVKRRGSLPGDLNGPPTHLTDSAFGRTDN
jgi:hypothetical protein